MWWLFVVCHFYALQEVTGTKDPKPDTACFTLSTGVANGAHRIRLEAIGNNVAQVVHISHLIVPK